MIPFTRFLPILACASLIACNRANPDDYAAFAPRFDIRQFYNGDLEGWGVVESDDGEPDHRFMMDMHGEWQGDHGRLHEIFHMDNGETSERTWDFTLIDEHRFKGTTGNVVGEMTGWMSGNAVHMDFIQTFPHGKKGGTVDLAMDDTIVLIDERHALDHIRLSKFGFKVGLITVAFRKS